MPSPNGNVSWMPVRIKESKIAVVGPFIGGYYTFGGKPPSPKEVVKEEIRALLKSLFLRFPNLEPDELLSLFKEVLKEQWPFWERG